LAAELAKHFPEASVTLVPSAGGRFEVTRDGVPIYEKSKTGRHAGPGEIVTLLRLSSGAAD
jgi:selenoprotein W-related protein